jgi:mannosyltransferase
VNVFFDNIVFALQYTGGVSVVWKELLKRVLCDSDITSRFIDFKTQNLFRQQLDIPTTSIVKNSLIKYPIKIQRYINPKLASDQGIFHSSYYRTVNNKNIINITTVHDFTYEYFRRGIPRIVHHQQIGNAIKSSQKIICVSNNTKSDLIHFYPDIKEDKIAVVYNGVSEEYHHLTQSEKLKTSYHIPFQTGEYVLFVGDRKSLYKNFNIAVKSCAIAKSPLVIVGGGYLSKNEKFFLDRTLGATNYFQLIGIDNVQLNILYNQAAFLLYPSIYEGFGIPVLEAQKAGCPVICSNKSSLPEVAGKGAIMLNDITPDNIAEILKQNNSRSADINAMINEGYVNSEHFSWDRSFQQTKQAYSEFY